MNEAKRLTGYSYKLMGLGNIPGLPAQEQANQFGLDVSFGPDDLEIDENEMSCVIPFADGNRVDGSGDVIEVAGIRTERHRANPIVLFDHGKQVTLPVALSEDPITKLYTVEIDPIAKKAKGKAFFYQGKWGGKNFNGATEYDHALFCEQLFDLLAKRYIRAGSIGYQVMKGLPMQGTYGMGIPQGVHLQEVNMLEYSAVVLPCNQDTVGKALSLKRVCGKPLSTHLVKSLSPYAPPRKAQMGYEGKKSVAHSWDEVNDTVNHTSLERVINGLEQRQTDLETLRQMREVADEAGTVNEHGQIRKKEGQKAQMGYEGQKALTPEEQRTIDIAQEMQEIDKGLEQSANKRGTSHPSNRQRVNVEEQRIRRVTDAANQRDQRGQKALTPEDEQLIDQLQHDQRSESKLQEELDKLGEPSQARSRSAMRDHDIRVIREHAGEKSANLQQMQQARQQMQQETPPHRKIASEGSEKVRTQMNTGQQTGGKALTSQQIEQLRSQLQSHSDENILGLINQERGRTGRQVITDIPIEMNTENDIVKPRHETISKLIEGRRAKSFSALLKSLRVKYRKNFDKAKLEGNMEVVNKGHKPKYNIRPEEIPARKDEEDFTTDDFWEEDVNWILDNIPGLAISDQPHGFRDEKALPVQQGESLFSIGSDVDLKALSEALTFLKSMTSEDFSLDEMGRAKCYHYAKSLMPYGRKGDFSKTERMPKGSPSSTQEDRLSFLELQASPKETHYDSQGLSVGDVGYSRDRGMPLPSQEVMQRYQGPNPVVDVMPIPRPSREHDNFYQDVISGGVEQEIHQTPQVYPQEIPDWHNDPLYLKSLERIIKMALPQDYEVGREVVHTGVRHGRERGMKENEIHYQPQPGMVMRTAARVGHVFPDEARVQFEHAGTEHDGMYGTAPLTDFTYADEAFPNPPQEEDEQ